MGDLNSIVAGLDPVALLGLGAAAALIFLLFLVVFIRLVSGGSSAALRELSTRLAETAAAGERGRAETLRLMEMRLDAVAERMGSGLGAAAERTAGTLGRISERLEAVEKLSGEMLGLQDILANKQARGVFGEVQLADLLRDALPPSVVALQATLSNGRRVDALLKLPDPPGPMAVDAKFPLEAYEALQAAQRLEGGGAEATQRAERQFRQAVKAHIAAIAERYLIPGETAEGALMFVPAESVYAEIHARMPDVVREGFAKKVWLVSPTTLMAVLVTLRGALRELEIQAQAGDIRREVRLLAQDVRRLFERSERLRSHMAQAETDLKEIAISAEKSLSRATRMEEGEAD